MTLKQTLILIFCASAWEAACGTIYNGYGNLRLGGIGFDHSQSRLKSLGFDYSTQYGSSQITKTLKKIEVEFKHDPMQFVGQRKTVQMLKQEWNALLNAKYQSEELQKAVQQFNSYKQINPIVEKSNGF